MAIPEGLEPLSQPLLLTCVCKIVLKPYYTWLLSPGDSEGLICIEIHIYDPDLQRGVRNGRGNVEAAFAK